MGTKKTTLQGQPKARPFDEVSPKAQALVMKAAKNREAAVWSQIKGLLQSEKKMTRAQVRECRAMMLSYFQRAAVLIFDTRAEGAADWDTWLRFVRQAATEAGLKLDGVEV
jgi:transcription initiation factor TFIID subunit TAF12